jgi:hypothetical protein
MNAGQAYSTADYGVDNHTVVVQFGIDRQCERYTNTLYGLLDLHTGNSRPILRATQTDLTLQHRQTTLVFNLPLDSEGTSCSVLTVPSSTNRRLDWAQHSQIFPDYYSHRGKPKLESIHHMMGYMGIATRQWTRIYLVPLHTDSNHIGQIVR